MYKILYHSYETHGMVFRKRSNDWCHKTMLAEDIAADYTLPEALEEVRQMILEGIQCNGILIVKVVPFEVEVSEGGAKT